MKLLLNAGFGRPLGDLTLRLIKGLGFSGVRQDATDPRLVPALVDELVAADLDAVFIVRDLTQAFAVAQATAPWDGFDIELGNEEDARQSPKDYAEWVYFVRDRLRDSYGFRPSLFTAGITTPDRKRLEWLRTVYATGNIAADVGCAIHTYRTTQAPWEAHKGFRSREEEYRAVREITGPRRRLIVSEVGWHTAPSVHRYGPWGMFGRRVQLTDEEVARYAVEECRIAADNGVESLTWFQLNDGPDATQYEHRFGIRRQDGVWKPVAAVLKASADGR